MIFKNYAKISKAITILMLIVSYNFLIGNFYIKPKSIHYNLYIDNDFSDVERLAIILATIEWTKATHNIVKYDLQEFPIQDINIENPLFITKVNNDYPKIAILDAYSKSTTLGFYDQDAHYIALVPSRTEGFIEFKSVVLHELGHSLGLEHNQGIAGIGTLMYPSVDLASDSITRKDLKNFCELYDCSENK